MKPINPSRRFFIPPWLDDSELRPIPFRVLCHLLRRAGENGLCYPSAKSIAVSCKIHKDSVWPALNTLEEAGIIKRLPKKFGGSNSYQITPSMSGKTGLIEEDPMSGKTGLIEIHQSTEKEGFQLAEKPGCQSAEKEGCKEIHLKKSNLMKSNRDILANPENELFLAESIASEKNPIHELAESIYKEYPRKVAKKEGIDAIIKAMKNHRVAFLKDKVRLFSEATKGREKRYIPHPATWFNKERFNDDPEEWKQPSRPSHHQQSKTTTTVDMGGRESSTNKNTEAV